MVLPMMDIVGAASDGLVPRIPGARARRRAQVLPCGVDTERFRPMARSEAREALGLDPTRPCLLFPADPSRPEKRHDLALAVADGQPLLTLGGVTPQNVPLWINAANVVLVPSDREGFGLAVLEALACDVPVLATPVGVHAAALAGIAGTMCAPFDLTAWREAAAGYLAADDPRVAGRARAEEYSMARMAGRVVGAWQAAVACAQ
jgi:glycosyltransferase involved in cell wall biosynthesis